MILPRLWRRFQTLSRQRRHARKLVREFVLADPTLWPILGEIDRALSD